MTVNIVNSSASTPKVSVLMPVFNGENFILKAIESVLCQSMEDFELLVLDDGSVDGTANIISSIKDDRVKIFRHENSGLPATLNKGIALSKAEYIARLDHDDIMLPDRLAKQCSFLDQNRNIGMVGTWAQIYVGEEPVERFHKHPCSAQAIRLHLLFDNPFVHSSLMIRKSIFEVAGCYTEDPDRLPPEDYELWSRFSRHCDLANIPDVLTIYREVPSSLSRAGINPFIKKITQFSSENIYAFMDGMCTYEECYALSSAYHDFDAGSQRIKKDKALEMFDNIVSRMARDLPADDEFSSVSARIKAKLRSRYFPYNLPVNIRKRVGPIVRGMVK